MIPRPMILGHRGCPFAQRVYALLDHLDVAYDAVESTAGQKPSGLGRWSPSGRVPMLVHGELAIGESRVMLEHLSEAYAFRDAYPTSLVERTLHRETMEIVDSRIAPNLLRGNALDAARLAEDLDRLEAIARSTAPAPCLLAFHLAPIWLRFQWWHPESAFTRSVRARKAIADWLDATTRISAVVHTTPNRNENVADYHAVVSTAP